MNYTRFVTRSSIITKRVKISIRKKMWVKPKKRRSKYEIIIPPIINPWSLLLNA